MQCKCKCNARYRAMNGIYQVPIQGTIGKLNNNIRKFLP